MYANQTLKEVLYCDSAFVAMLLLCVSVLPRSSLGVRVRVEALRVLHAKLVRRRRRVLERLARALVELLEDLAQVGIVLLIQLGWKEYDKHESTSLPSITLCTPHVYASTQ